jgi:PKHD-type hydroxylase
MVRDNAQRRILFELDSSVQELREAIPDHLSLAKLTGVYNNLLRYWARP